MPCKIISQYNDAELALLILEGNENAFSLLYEKFNDRIFIIAKKYLKSEIVAQEVVQDVFMKLWSERGNIKSGTPIDAWLYTVAKNNSINRLKRLANEWKAKNYLRETQKTHEDSAQNKLKDSDCKRILHLALNSLSNNQLKVYRLIREENLSYVNAAKRLNISPLTVKTHMSRALGQLKLFFTGY